MHSKRRRFSSDEPRELSLRVGHAPIHLELKRDLPPWPPSLLKENTLIHVDSCTPAEKASYIHSVQHGGPNILGVIAVERPPQQNPSFTALPGNHMSS